MATFIFSGFQPTFFNGLRDVNGVQLGYIEPGQIVDIAEAPNYLFAPVDVPESTPVSVEPVPGGADVAPAPEAPAPAPEPVPQPAPQAASFQPTNATQAIVH